MRMFARKNKVHICNGDEVVVISGAQKGIKGVVKSVFPKKSTILVEGVNRMKKATKVNQNNGNEHYMITERPIFISKVKVVKKKDKKNVRSSDKKD